MIAADTSTLVAYFAGEQGDDVDRVAAALVAGELALPPVVLTEMLSDPRAAPALADGLTRIVLLSVDEAYWMRAGESRRLLHSKGLKAKIADALIAQSCIDHNVALITRDGDFRHFAEHCGLRLA